jgi:hypothetical protein
MPGNYPGGYDGWGRENYETTKYAKAAKFAVDNFRTWE